MNGTGTGPAVYSFEQWRRSVRNRPSTPKKTSFRRTSTPRRARVTQANKETPAMTTPFACTRIATAVAGVALALGAGQAFGTGFQLNEQSASSIGNAFAAGAAFTDDVTAMWWNPAALSKFKQGTGRRRHQRHHALDQVPERRLAAGRLLPACVLPWRVPAPRGDRRRRGRLQLRAEPVPLRPDQPAVDVRSRGQRAVRSDDRVRRRLDRPLPGSQVGDQDDSTSTRPCRGR